MKSLSIDLETYSDVDLSKCGVYKYTESKSFEILLFGYCVDSGEVQVIDLASGEEIPIRILKALTDKNVLKWAFNASFERVCLSAYLRRNYPQYFSAYGTKDDTVGNYLDPESWRCSMVWSAYMGLPLSLAGVGGVLGLDKQKLSEGKELIRYFCVPCKPTISNGGRVRNLSYHAPDKWEMFKAYNKRDVEAEMSIQNRLAKFPVPDFIWEEYALDQKINDRGIAVDLTLVNNAIEIDEISKGGIYEKLQKLTKTRNPNSVIQMKEWLKENGLELDSLGKKEISKAIKTADEPVKTALTLRSQLAKSSVKKYQAMKNAACEDSRARGMFQFYGANRSGRWAGRIIQLQNLPQNHLPDLAQARELVAAGDVDMLALLYGDVPDTLSQLIRTAFIPDTGYKFIVADFSAVEARVLAWLAGEEWRMRAFADGKDIYCASASQMFGVPVEKHGVNGHLRQKGKIAELALGYGGSVGALKAMGATDIGLKEEELKPLVDSWRKANPNIVKLWWKVDQAAKVAIKRRTSISLNNLVFTYKSGMLFITLPSGRKLTYVKPKMTTNHFGSACISYMGIGATKKWERIETYGPKLVENITQGVSRDLLMHSMQTLGGYRICAHVHDELIIECVKEMSLDDICEQMALTPPWAEGLLLKADGYECEFYRKD